MNTLVKLAIAAVITFITSTVFAMGTGGVEIQGKNTQSVTSDAIMNFALGQNAIARQALASNLGNVKIGGDNTQTVTSKAIMNFALGQGAQAKQSISSNDSNP